jgi:hypothetical protein
MLLNMCLPHWPAHNSQTLCDCAPRFKALEPLPDAGVSELSAAAAEAAAGRQQQQAAAEQQAAQIVELALAAVKTSGQD